MPVSNVEIIDTAWSGTAPARQFSFRVRATVTNDTPYQVLTLMVTTNVKKVVGGNETQINGPTTLNLVAGTTYQTTLISVGEFSVQPGILIKAYVSATWTLKREEINVADDDHTVNPYP